MYTLFRYEHLAIYVEPKLNTDNQQTNYLQMLFSALKNPEILNYSHELFEIKFDTSSIEIDQSKDLLTPLLVIHFLQIIRMIVRKGLKKSFYNVEQNLNARIKGKILIGKTIKENILKGRQTNTFCRFDEFGYNSLENRLLKKALLFVQRYLPFYLNLACGDLEKADRKEQTTEIFNFIMPAFQMVDEHINLNEIKFTKTNVFYKEYTEGIKLAKMILKRFGYNITNVEKTGKVKVPPFWIDMSKLFELYVYGKLKEIYRNSIIFQASAEYGNPDFLLITENEKIVIDAKYKSYYKESLKGQIQWKRDNIVKDIRQLSGYARDRKVLEHFHTEGEIIIPCLIIFPDQSGQVEIPLELL